MYFMGVSDSIHYFFYKILLKIYFLRQINKKVIWEENIGNPIDMYIVETNLPSLNVSVTGTYFLE